MYRRDSKKPGFNHAKIKSWRDYKLPRDFYFKYTGDLFKKDYFLNEKERKDYMDYYKEDQKEVMDDVFDWVWDTTFKIQNPFTSPSFSKEPVKDFPSFEADR